MPTVCISDVLNTCEQVQVDNVLTVQASVSTRKGLYMLYWDTGFIMIEIVLYCKP